MSYDKTNHNYRELITGVDTKIPLKNGKLVTAINFDNAATTPPFNYVMEKVVSFSPYYSSIHREPVLNLHYPLKSMKHRGNLYATLFTVIPKKIQ